MNGVSSRSTSQRLLTVFVHSGRKPERTFGLDVSHKPQGSKAWIQCSVILLYAQDDGPVKVAETLRRWNRPTSNGFTSLCAMARGGPNYAIRVVRYKDCD